MLTSSGDRNGVPRDKGAVIAPCGHTIIVVVSVDANSTPTFAPRPFFFAKKDKLNDNC